MAYKRQRSEDVEYKDFYREEEYFHSIPSSSAPDSPESVISYSPDSPLSISSYPESDPPSPPSPPSQFSPSAQAPSTHPPKKCRYTTIYDEMLRPLSPVTVLPFPSTCTTRSPNVNPNLQQEFLKLVAKGCKEELGRFLEQHSEKLSMNQYSQVDGCTPLQRVCQDGAVNALPVARLLVQHGADPKLTSRDGWSPIHLASFSGNSALMLYMIKCPK